MRGPTDANDEVDGARSRHRKCHRVIVGNELLRGHVYMQVTTIGLDLAKNVFQVHGVDAAGKIIVQRQLRRGQVIEFFKKVPPVWSAWRRARRPTTGRVRYRRSGTRCD